MLSVKIKKTVFLIQGNDYYQFKRFLELGALACFSNRRLDLGFASPDLAKNRKDFLKKINVNYKDLVCCQQPHGGKVFIINQPDIGKGAQSFTEAVADCDALITDCKNIPLAVFTADCLPIFLLAPRRKVVAMVHAGWRGTKEGIVKNTLDVICSKFNVQAKELLVGLGPVIRQCCYEVKDEFKDYFKKEIMERAGRLYLDLIKINLSQLESRGVLSENIIDCGFCTACATDEFFSYRREGGACGRMISLIMLK